MEISDYLGCVMVDQDGCESEYAAKESSRREKTKKSIVKLAKDLIELYARRSVVPGYAFAPDTPWQTEMEESFPYEPTPDQLKAVDDIKADRKLLVYAGERDVRPSRTTASRRTGGPAAGHGMSSPGISGHGAGGRTSPGSTLRVSVSTTANHP